MPGFAALAHPWWVPVLYIVIVGHISNICVTLYLHRSATHEGVRFAQPVEWMMRLWLWLTTGMNTREWVAVHRKHHAHTDREGDPHSPHTEGLMEIVCGGVFFYREEAKNPETIAKYGRGCPEDFMETKLYTPRPAGGILLMLLVDLYLFGIGWGLIAWACMAVWIPIFGNVINGVGHAVGYRNFDTKDHSKNIIPLGLWIVGEELHNNHHADPRSAKFSAKPFEFDIGWLYIRLLSALHLAKVVYARNVTAREFAEKYYKVAATTATDVTATANSAIGRAQVAAGDALGRAQAAAGDALGRAQESVARAGESVARAGETVALAAETIRKEPRPAIDG